MCVMSCVMGSILLFGNYEMKKSRVVFTSSTGIWADSRLPFLLKGWGCEQDHVTDTVNDKDEFKMKKNTRMGHFVDFPSKIRCRSSSKIKDNDKV